MRDEHGLAVERPQLRTMLLLGALLAVLLLAVTGSTPLTAKADAACESGSLCLWSGANYNGFIGNYTCGVALGVNLPTTFSVKNRCSNNVRMGWNEAGFVNWKFCMSPGGERPEPGRLNYAGPC